MCEWKTWVVGLGFEFKASRRAAETQRFFDTNKGPGLLDDVAFWMMHQALEPNGFIHTSPGQGRLCGRRPGLSIPSHRRLKACLIGYRADLPSMMQTFSLRFFKPPFPRATPDLSGLPWASMSKPVGLVDYSDLEFRISLGILSFSRLGMLVPTFRLSDFPAFPNNLITNNW